MVNNPRSTKTAVLNVESLTRTFKSEEDWKSCIETVVNNFIQYWISEEHTKWLRYKKGKLRGDNQNKKNLDFVRKLNGVQSIGPDPQWVPQKQGLKWEWLTSWPNVFYVQSALLSMLTLRLLPPSHDTHGRLSILGTSMCVANRSNSFNPLLANRNGQNLWICTRWNNCGLQ